jgi:hypothetical protein
MTADQWFIAVDGWDVGDVICALMLVWNNIDVISKAYKDAMFDLLFFKS